MCDIVVVSGSAMCTDNVAAPAAGYSFGFDYSLHGSQVGGMKIAARIAAIAAITARIAAIAAIAVGKRRR